MEDPSLTNRSSLGHSGLHTQGISRPKFQPVRVKALLHFGESDDEDDDDNENKACDSEDESDNDSPSQNECVENVDHESQFPSQKECANDVDHRSLLLPQEEHAKGIDHESQSPSRKEFVNDIDNRSSKYPNSFEIAKPESSKNLYRSNLTTKEPICDKYKTQYDKASCPLSEVDGSYSGNVVTLRSNETKEDNREGRSIRNDNLCVSDAGNSMLKHVTPMSSHPPDTPLKSAPPGTVRPNPCLSHRNIFQTPQSKMQGDLAKSSTQTPSTIGSFWLQSSTRQTPLGTKPVKEYVHTPVNSIFMQSGQFETPRYFVPRGKTDRRPLSDAVCFTQPNQFIGESFTSSTDSKPHKSYNKQLPKITETIQDVPRDSCSKRDLDPIHSGEFQKNLPPAGNEIKIQMNTNVEESKENVHSNVVNVPENKLRLVNNMNVENSNIPASCNKKNVGAKNNFLQTNENHGICLENKDCPEPVNQKSQKAKQIKDSILNVQFAISANPPMQGRNKTILVKNKEYLILGTLGQGMSGEVLRVQDLSSSELCAIKCVNLNRMDKDSAQGCLEEISMLHKLQAPCIVRMFDYEIIFPMVYVVMEMGDTDLSRLLKQMSQEKRLPLTMILYYWTEMLTAVKHIHDNGVIHSDLKPANFLLVRGRLKLIDFGIASSMNGDMTSVVKNCPIGTLNYISPEALMDIGGNGDSPNQNVKYKISYKSDVWSLGCILYGLVYGHTPFHHIRSQWAKVNAIINPKPSIVFPTTVSINECKFESPPPILIDVMRKCLQHDPKVRPTVSQLLQIEYIPMKQASTSVPISPHVLVKIKSAVTEEEWRSLMQILEK